MPAIPFTLWAAYGLTGGGAGSPDLDYFDGDLLADGDIAWVFDDNFIYHYILDADSALSEDSPNVISPDSNAGDKRWILQGMFVKKSKGEVNAIGSIGGGTQDLDFSIADTITGTVDTSETTFTFSNPPASGMVGVWLLVLTNGGSQTVNWPAAVDFVGGSAPSLTTSGVDWLIISTTDGGTTYSLFEIGLDVQSP